MTARADFVTVFHNERNHAEQQRLRASLLTHEPDGGYTYISVDNRVHNRGFAGGCNAGAFAPGADAPVIGFLNPDALITGPFLAAVERALANAVITGCRYGKADRELHIWGVTDWVCGAAMFVRRSWFAGVGGFDTQFVWGWEETDLIRQAQAQGLRCQSIDLPIEHSSPAEDNNTDAAYKRAHFQQGAQRFYRKWSGRRAPGFAGRR
jgi:GT2 family glycosyltransferase